MLPPRSRSHPGGALTLVDAEGGNVGPVHRPDLTHAGSSAQNEGVNFKIQED